MKTAVIIGAGAAGSFCAIELKRRSPETEILLLEAGEKPLAKLALTGGGRCNLTNTFAGIRDIRDAYPRGHQLMKRALHAFGPEATMRWYEDKGVRLVEEDGGRIFPASGDALQIVHTLLRELDRPGIQIRCRHRVTDIRPVLDGADAVIVTTGGSPKRAGLGFLDPLGLPIEEPVPSLFTLKTGEKDLKALMGTVAPDAILSIPGTGFRAAAPLLLTDWGFGGPATLKLSSYAARHLAACEYRTPLSVNWTGGNEQSTRQQLAGLAGQYPQRMAVNTPLPGLPARLWALLLSRSGLRADIRWAEMGSKSLNRLVSTLTNDRCESTGRAAFKEEFVTCGGIALSGLQAGTLEAREHPGLFFAGEVLDIDAITGGFNLQAAWTTGWICAQSAANYLKK